MTGKYLILCGLTAACFGAAAYAAAPARRITAIDRALARRAQYDPFALKRQAVEERLRAATPVAIRVQGTAVRPPYRPETRSPYQPPVRGPYIASTRQ